MGILAVIQSGLQSKIVGAKIFAAKVLRLTEKTAFHLRNNPRLLPGKVYRKLKRIILNRFDVGFFHRNEARIGGNFYPLSELLPSKELTANASEIPEIFVIVPVYRNIAVTKRCIDSLMASNLPDSAKVLILNDCSPDQEMPALLDSYKVHPRVDVRHNMENVGFVRNVNTGMAIAGKADVVLLNSDTVVAGDWLQRLYWQANTRENISSVTATSSNATICSFPVMEGTSGWPMGRGTDEIQRLFARHNNKRSVEIPTAVGFCMFITRRSLAELGNFDEEAFGKGYGEENDFCLRGLSRGWKHLQALDVGVFHEGEVSFGGASHPGKLRAAEIILKRYPNYNDLIGEFAQVDKARAMRLGALLALIAEAGKPVELICTHIHGGGVEKAVNGFVKERAKNINFLRLQRAAEKGFYKITSLIEGIEFELDFSSTYAPVIFKTVMDIAKVTRIHIHHVMDFDTLMLNILRNAEIPFDFYIHDYWTLCPQVTLTTIDGSYCGEPDQETCNRCIARRGERTHAPLAAGLAGNIAGWRGQYGWLFAEAQEISAPSQDVVNRMKKYYPGAKIRVDYHEPQAQFTGTPVRLRPLAHDGTLNIAVLGSIGVHKGFYKISDLQGEINRRGLPLKITIFGEIDPLLTMPNPVTVFGRYDDRDLPALLPKVGIHIIWFPEGAPETYSYTLSHAMAFGYPVVAPKIGAFPERLMGRPWTEMTELGARAEDVAAQILNIRDGIVSESK